MYNNPFNYLYNRPNVEDINSRIQELEKIKSQIQQPMQQPTNLTQNFQLAPTSNEMIRYANSIEDVQKVFVIGDTPYFSKDLSVVWIKNAKGEIKTYELKEIVKKDDKDIKIETLLENNATLLNEIEELKKELKMNEQCNNDDVNEPIEDKKPTISKPISKSSKK